MGELIQVNKRVRIESGPARRKAKATAELLSNDNTQDHYQEGARDADFNVIEIGKPMVYLDYFGEPVWYVYQMDENEVYQEVGVHTEREAAETQARSL